MLLCSILPQESDEALAEELETARTRLRTRFFRELRPQAGKAEALGHYHTTLGDYHPLFAVADSYARVAAADVRGVALTLSAKQRTVVIAEPSGAEPDDDDDDDGDEGDDDGAAGDES